MTIRPADTSDIQAVADLLRRACATVAERFGLTMENCPKSPAFTTADRVRADLDRGVRYYLLEADGQMCGCVALEEARPGVCYLERLAVVPECRSQGWGRTLACHALAEAARIGAQRVEIAIIEENTQLKDWYGRLGFTPTGTKTFDHLPFVVGFMAKEL